jgi:hypothetical protein
MRTIRFNTATALMFAVSLTHASAQDKAHLQLDSPFASYVEADFPFFTQTIDARKFGATPQNENLTPRGIIVSAGNGVFGCFDPDLLRWALVWKGNAEGEYLSMNGMGAGSYRQPSRKAAPGQGELPRPFGIPLLSMPQRPGVATGETHSARDPRERGNADPGELGLGPVPESLGRFSGIRLVEGGAQLEYQVAGDSGAGALCRGRYGRCTPRRGRCARFSSSPTHRPGRHRLVAHSPLKKQDHPKDPDSGWGE